MCTLECYCCYSLSKHGDRLSRFVITKYLISYITRFLAQNISVRSPISSEWAVLHDPSEWAVLHNPSEWAVLHNPSEWAVMHDPSESYLILGCELETGSRQGRLPASISLHPTVNCTITQTQFLVECTKVCYSRASESTYLNFFPLVSWKCSRNFLAYYKMNIRLYSDTVPTGMRTRPSSGMGMRYQQYRNEAT